jgi:hypothetical protein
MQQLTSIVYVVKFLFLLFLIEFFYFWKQAIQRFSGEHIAPPWFAAAMAAALAPLEARMIPTEARTIRIEARVFNALATLEEDTIMAPIIPPLVAAPLGFPTTVLELRSLSNNNCNVCMTAYDLILAEGVQNTVAEKRRLLARFLGVPL